MKRSLKKNKNVNEQIERLEKILESIDPKEDPDLYQKIANILADMNEINKKKKFAFFEYVHLDTIIFAVVSIAEVLLIKDYEKEHVITSKAFHLIPRGRV